MGFYTLRRAWTSLLVVGIPVAFLALAWAAFMGGRGSVAALAFVYLLIVACGRALAIKKERDERPYRDRRVAHQLARIRSTLPCVSEPLLHVVETPPEVETTSRDEFGGGREPAASERSPVEGLTLRAV
jgi:hypothetical protein